MALLLNILIIIQFLPLLIAINPIFSPCDTDANTTTVDCSNRRLRYIPLIKSTTVISIDLSYNKIKNVGQYLFSGVPKLHSLKIMWNCVPVRPSSCKMELHHHAFKSLHKLQILHLAGNSLTSIPWLPESLRVLDLQFNHIFSITNSLKTPHLETLFLKKNCFYVNPCDQSLYINKSVFRELPKLKNLDLGFSNLTEIPPGLPPSLESLDLRENTITGIPEGAFANLTVLRDLNLEWNCQRCDHAARPCFPCPQDRPLQLNPKSFYAENSSIIFLSLRGNSLRTFPDGLFQPLRKLKKLDLSDNLLTYAIRNGTFFTELKGLTWISLIYNYEPLKTFPELILSPHLGNISGLQYLLLSGNFFHTLSTDSLKVISKLKHLQFLELRMNFINRCNLTVLKQLPSLIKVDLSQNMLTFLQCCSGPSAESVSQQRCQNQNSHSNSSPPPPLMLFDREVTRSDQLEHDQSNLSEMSEDDVVHIPTIWDFKHHFCQHKLTVDLSQNDILYLTKHLFLGMENSVCLDLSSNYMSQSLKKGPFETMKKLVYLNMAFNRIDLYYSDAFIGLRPTLRVLDLSNNQFHFEMKGMGHRFEFLQHLTNLEVLSLANNKIGMRIDQRLISSSLKYLYFSGNHLDYMWASNNNYIHFFQNLSNLIYLDISENELRSVSRHVLCSLPRSIKTLSISNNRLKYFPWENITALSNLCHLDLRSNHLTYLPYAAIQFGMNLSLLDLSHNRIGSVPMTFFENFQSLRYLYLNHNHIKQLSQRFLPAPFRNGSALKRVTLHGNPFRCDCDTSWFAEFLRTTPVEVPYLSTDVHCEFPEILQGRSVLLMDQRSCQDTYGSLAFLITVFMVMISTVLPLLKHLYGWNLWYCIQVLWAGQKGYTQLPGTDSSNHYDAFVVFDIHNKSVRDWVYNELTVHLETSGYRRFGLCLEERDWIPGLSCIENLHNAVYSSMKTVFVLSGGGSKANGAEAVNGVIRQAFFMVQQRLLDEKVDVAVLVLLDEMFPRLKYLQLRKRLCRKSVLSWPRNPHAQPLFWNSMRMALSSDNLNLYDNNMSESFL
ncbi:toll-like receptor 9 isoform X1 [Genypterus blacodes]|uniref:toll-like receptor 9 isoform X1 n=1 Tax=Genypterus blacodes TaxID=154954 RepID=UPI003F76FB2D